MGTKEGLTLWLPLPSGQLSPKFHRYQGVPGGPGSSRWAIRPHTCTHMSLRSREAHSPPSSTQIIYATGSHWSHNHGVSPGFPAPSHPHAYHAHHPGEEVTGKCYYSRGLGLSRANCTAWPFLQFEGLFCGLCCMSLPITGHPPPHSSSLRLALHSCGPGGHWPPPQEGERLEGSQS